MRDAFRRFSSKTAEVIGSPAAFIISSAVTILWLFSGPLFHFSDTWQLVMNTVTSVGAFVIAILIQNTQNRDTKALQLKLDELLRAVDGARTELVNLESLSDEEIEHLQSQFERLAEGRRRAAGPMSTAPSAPDVESAAPGDEPRRQAA
jgi:low affinity Fe/Cu permease